MVRRPDLMSSAIGDPWPGYTTPMVSEIFLFFSAVVSVNGMNTTGFALAGGVMILIFSSAIWVCFFRFWLSASCLAADYLLLVFSLTSETASVFFIFSSSWHLWDRWTFDNLVSQFFTVVASYYRTVFFKVPPDTTVPTCVR